MIRRGLAALGLALTLGGCAGDDVTTISGTTIRLGTAVAKGESGPFALRIFDSEEDCAKADSVSDAERELCKPFVDRATGTVRIAFQLMVDSSPTPMVLRPDAIEVLHDGHNPARADDARVQLIPHEPSSSGDLYILLLDTSGSMAIVDGADGVTRMEKLRKALLRKDVVEAFFGGGGHGEVAPLMFRGADLPVPLGDKWVVNDPEEYRRTIRDNLQSGQGYTYLYQAVKYGATGLAEQADIKTAVLTRGLAPTVITLTDGFNNERPADVCGDNAPRLQALLEALQGVRLGKGVPGYQPDIYTVGLGRRAWRKFKVPEGVNVSASQLCPGWSDYPIDGGVERNGVDNAALAWIAKVGNGESFVRKDADGLAEAFKAAAQKRYMWFEARYKTDPFHLRRGFSVTIRMSQPYAIEATVPVYPNAWVDGPPGTVGADGWPVATSFRASLVVLMSCLSLLVAWNYLPAALFNTRRALFGIVWRSGKG